MDSNEKLLLSPREAAKVLCISERTLWTLTKPGLIGCFRIGAVKRYSIREIERFIESQTERDTSPLSQPPIP